MRNMTDAFRGISCAAVMAALLIAMPGCEPPKGKSPDSIFGKKTQDIGEFKPEAGKEVGDNKVQVTNVVTGPLEAYRPMVSRAVTDQIGYAIRLYEAENGQFPQTYDEFMTKIIKANNIQLPVLPGGWKYEYDVANHELKTVHDGPAPDAPAAPAP